MKPLSVSELNLQLKALLEQSFATICVEGEISSLTKHTSGHIYLSIKDVDSSIKCVMFRSAAQSLKITLEVGQRIIINGAISVYAPKGEYQVMCKSITLAGIGDLSKEFEKLKAKLKAKGYFESANKKPMPKFPKRIALLTSATGAAKEDMLKVAKKRWEALEIVLFNTIVQGESAANSLISNLTKADSLYGTKKGFDVIIMGRGGGSMEDMWAFNDEGLADAIYVAQTPIISAVGHEIDYFISDFVADLRAPTPSAAMEMLLPDKFEYLRLCDDMTNALCSAISAIFGKHEESLEQLKQSFGFFNFEAQCEVRLEQISALFYQLNQNYMNALKEREALLRDITLDSSFSNILESAFITCEKLQSALEAQNPKLICNKGFVQLSKDGKVIKLGDIALDSGFSVSDMEQSISAKRIR